MNIKTISILFFLIWSLTGFAQHSRRPNIWYFGRNAGIDFNTTPPTPLTDGAMETWEGCSTICDTFGQLVMYTDGIFVWNKNHQIVAGAVYLGGSNSSTQSGTILPLPGTSSQYYVFSTSEEGNPGGLQYAVIDMSLNGGQGGVVNKNNVLLPESTEKVTLIRHCNFVDYWLIAHQTNSTNFYIWKITNSGISAPVVQSIGTFHGSGNQAVGYMKCAPNGSKLCVAGYGANFFELFDFNNITGVLSNPLYIKNAPLNNAYGMEFSPNGKFLYLAGTQNEPLIFQYNLSLPSHQEILNSYVKIGNGTSSYFGALQSGPDGKIYIAKDNEEYLSVINQPNLPGNLCNFVENQFYLGGKKSAIGLPGYLAEYFIQPVSIIIKDSTDMCTGTVHLFMESNAEGDSIDIQWYLNDQLLQNKKSGDLTVDSSGKYTVKMQVFKFCIPEIYRYSASKNVDFLKITHLSFIEKTICAGAQFEGYTTQGLHIDTFKTVTGCDSVRTISLKFFPQPLTNVKVNICDGDSFEGYTKTGTYTDVFPDVHGCDSTRVLNLNVLPNPKSTLTISICEGEKYEGYSATGVYVDTLSALNGCDSIRTLKLMVRPKVSTMKNATICAGQVFQGYSAEGTYTDVFQSANGCDSTRILKLTVLPNITTNPSINICKGDTYYGYSTDGTYTDLFNSVNGCDSTRILELKIKPNYSSNQNVTICSNMSYDFNGRLITKKGSYMDTLKTIFGCDSIIHLDVFIQDGSFLGNDTTICDMNEYYIPSPVDNTIWFDHTVSKTKKVNTSGSYWATIIDSAGCEVSDTIQISFKIKTFIPNAFNPDAEGLNNCFKPFFSAEQEIQQYRLSIFDGWGSLMFQSSNSSECWYGDFKGKYCNPGVYTYFLEIYTNCGRTMKKGDVTLIR